ncbi:hypothetical protein PYR77_00790 [Acinetobacter soli]|uniref:hypothetical protein n=1 Tax=Acinetobacter soli TaxID=487316 RepID=UPI002090F30C|nr:hypothetical protein [Acinetobacter soli]WEH98728.1 hypothetical protein PYR76_07200 [Acinetobacter soli]WEI00680.1 hypothetical protein PYR77_00790 [Acinetobacter soli]
MKKRTQGMNKTFLALSVNVLMIGGVYAADDVASASSQEKSAEQATATQSSEAPAQGSVFTESNSTAAAEATASTPAPAVSSNSAAEALQKQEGDATQESNLQEVFTSNERQYSLIKRGEISSYYDIDYTYYRDTRLDLAIEDGTVNQLRVEEGLF